MRRGGGAAGRGVEAGGHALAVVEAEARRVAAGLTAAGAEVLDDAVGGGQVRHVRRVLQLALQVHLPRCRRRPRRRSARDTGCAARWCPAEARRAGGRWRAGGALGRLRRCCAVRRGEADLEDLADAGGEDALLTIGDDTSHVLHHVDRDALLARRIERMHSAFGDVLGNAERKCRSRSKCRNKLECLTTKCSRLVSASQLGLSPRLHLEFRTNST